MNNPTVITINGKDYEKVNVFLDLKDGDIVLGSYFAGDAKWNIRGGFDLLWDADTLLDGEERLYNRIQRWQVTDRRPLRFELKRAKSGIKPNYPQFRIAGGLQFAWREVK